MTQAQKKMESKHQVESTTQEHQLPALKPVRPALRIVLLVGGTLALGVGIIGLVLPVLPTTPFLLIAAGCYIRSSPRLYHWLIHHPRLGPSVRRYIAQKAIPLQVKLISLAIAWAVLGGSALFLVQAWWLKGLLIAVALAKTAFMLRVATLDQDALAP